MAEHWISASKALEICQNSFALCARAHTGLIAARARLLVIGERQAEWADVPKGFWWATGHAALEQDWEAGDFSTWIEQKHPLKAYGVTFALSGVLEMLEVAQRPVLARQLSVAGNPEWIATKEVIQTLITSSVTAPSKAEKYLSEQGRLGFVAARAVMAQGIYGDNPNGERHWDAREWDIPTSIWQMFAEADELLDDWEVGKFSARGRSREGLTVIILSGVHFHCTSVQSLTASKETKEQSDGKRGRRPTYDWATATAAIWGKLFRNELMPETQADIERALIDNLTAGDKSPSPSTVRPYAKPIWEEFNKP